jgi:glycosyltransferase involved in cell wall biosynthesis
VAQRYWKSFEKIQAKDVTMPRKPKKTTILVGIPAYNEEKTIAKVIVNSKRYADRIMVADDGSTDDTGLIAEGLGAKVLRHARNRGKGEALKTIFRSARNLRADVLVTLDADGQHDPHEIPALTRPILEHKADIIIGSREKQEIPKLRRAAHRVLDMATSVSDIDGAIVDSQSGYRAYSRRAIDELNFYEPGMGAEALVLKSAKALGLVIRQVPITVKYQGTAGHSMNPISHFSDVFSAIVKTVILKRPLRSLGIPGSILVLVGLYWWIQILDIYNASRQFAIGNALVASVILLVGFFMAISAVILIAIVLAIQERG